MIFAETDWASFTIQILTLLVGAWVTIQLAKLKVEADKQTAALEEVKTQTNGMQTKLQAMSRREGVQEGVAQEAAREATASPREVKVVNEEPVPVHITEPDK